MSYEPASHENEHQSVRPDAMVSYRCRHMLAVVLNYKRIVVGEWDEGLGLRRANEEYGWGNILLMRWSEVRKARRWTSKA